MSLKKLSWVRPALLVLIAFVTGVAAAGYIEKAWRSPGFRFRDPGTIEQYLKSHSVRKLQLGAGSNNPAGWLNTDIEPEDKQVYLDATARYPFADGSLHYIFSEHVIEHVPWEAGIIMLRECYRVLAKGGKLRIVTPNLTKFVQLLNGTPDAEAQRFIDAKFRMGGVPVTPIPGIYILNRQVREWGHQFLYDPPTLRKSLELTGFKQISQYEINEKTDPVFQEVEIRIRHSDPDLKLINSWEAMAFEAVR
ncbi:MAG: methyltransferase domain-containing protein [Deltaproteobacteria bacterium]|nr:methyltransferase domain-containing protein [Deltaproteobacteria bacterium]